MRSKLTFIFLATILLASCAAPTPQPTATAVPTSTRTAAPTPTATPTLRPPTASEPSWIQNGDELLIFDPAVNEWKPAMQAADTDLPIYNVSDDKQVIVIGKEWLAISSIDDSEKGQVITTKDGQKWAWGEAGWEVVLPQENTLTYKNYDGQEVTVELPLYHYTNKAGETLEIVHPPDQMACLKYLAEESRWFPANSDQAQNRKLFDAPPYGEGPLWPYLAQYGITFPPQDRRTWGMAYPLSGGFPFMTVFVTGWEGGTLAVGQKEDGTYFPIFCEVAPDEFVDQANHFSETVEYQYLQELATQHQE